MISKKKIIKLAQERIDELDSGCYLVDVIISRGNNIIVEIDNANAGVAINDIVSVSRNIEHNLDRETEDFKLDVTSPGLDKPFKVLNQYHKNINKTVKVIYDVDKILEGILLEVNKETIIVETKEIIKENKKKTTKYNKKVISHKNIKQTKLIF
jgi:ribosome maturation factor RimP